MKRLEYKYTYFTHYLINTPEQGVGSPKKESTSIMKFLSNLFSIVLFLFSVPLS